MEAAAHLAGAFDLPQSRARVLLARNEPSSALALLEPLRGQMEARSWQDERLKAPRLLIETMGLAEGEGFIRLFLDEGAPMARLLGIMPAYAGKLLTAFAAEKQMRESALVVSASSLSPSLTDPLSRRELEVKRRTEAIARGRELGLL